eukprot:CAMPEP_0201947588 /NCGR_PEP_ID=MMETSP0903-20130614/55017_1 /ASSEMBLY_ACC=CAM_ASM_000552 /TAXON_ID=420261 /ORGANISM="Thalassiosira antarctica, Strain CCMP982" /LENGTH=506 /DNA_ID=CAMNT_0048490735 /DNA_START=290 /DNA_END=1810 /DNA_ORIENTATION=-
MTSKKRARSRDRVVGSRQRKKVNSKATVRMNMKRMKSKRQQKQKEKSKSTNPTELSSPSSLAAAISEASATTKFYIYVSSSQQQQKQPQQRKIFNHALKKSSHSQKSLATNTSFVTASENVHPNENVTLAASYSVNSSDEDTNEGLNFGKDPLASRTTSPNTTPTEISFCMNPEETPIMPSKKSSMSKIAPFTAEATPFVLAPVTTAPAPKKDPPVVVIAKTTKEDEEEAHFDIAQNVYGTAKNVCPTRTLRPSIELEHHQQVNRSLLSVQISDLASQMCAARSTNGLTRSHHNGFIHEEGGNNEETNIVLSKKSSKSKITPVMAEVTPFVSPPATTALAPKKDSHVVVIAKTTEEDDEEEEAHFDIAQNVYGTAKNVWAWGKTIPIITTLLGLTETIATKVLDTTIHMDLPAIDENGVKSQLKKLDDDIVTPAILAVWKIIEPAIAKGVEMVVKSVLTEVLPLVLGSSDKKKEEGEKKKKVADEKKAVIDSSPTPEVVPALNFRC